MSSLRSVFGSAAVLVAAMFFFAPVATADADCAAITTPTAAPGEDVPAQLACADLRGFDFLQEDLTGADLHGSNLVGVRLIQATLSGADLRGANLVGANLGQADLDGANLSGADLTGATLGQADLTGADLRDAVLRDAELIQATLTGADLRGADLTGADLTQAETDANLPPVDEAEDAADRAAGLNDEPPVLNPGDGASTIDLASGTGPQIAFLLLWPAAAIVLAWLRTRFGNLARHRRTTPIRAVDVVGGVVGVSLVMAGLYLAVVATVRSIAGDAEWARDGGPLSLFGTGTVDQFLTAAGAFVLGVIVLSATRRRKQERGSPTAGQVALGRPTPGRIGSGFSRPVRWFAVAVAIACLVDLVLVVVLLATDSLPATGLWQADTAAGHLAFVAIATVILFRTSANTYTGHEVATLSGAVFVTGVREPFLWLSGKTSDDRPASQALPWEALDRVHFIRVLGTSRPGSAMISVRAPGADRPSEYPKELRVTETQVTALYAVLPPEMFTEHTRAPLSD